MTKPDWIKEIEKANICYDVSQKEISRLLSALNTAISTLKMVSAPIDIDDFSTGDIRRMYRDNRAEVRKVLESLGYKPSNEE